MGQVQYWQSEGLGADLYDFYAQTGRVPKYE